MTNLSEIQAACEKHFGLAPDSIFKKVRNRGLADARKAFRLVAARNGYSIAEMNKVFVGFAAESVRNMLSAAEGLFLNNQRFYEAIKDIEMKLRINSCEDEAPMPNMDLPAEAEAELLTRLDRIIELLNLLVIKTG